MNPTTIKSRFLVSVVANALRASLTLLTGILLARGLDPSGYGDLAFLLGSFVAVRALLNMGSSSAFYTFLSQRARERRFYLFYFSWLALQFVITLSLVALIIPHGLFEKIWLGHSRGIVLLAFVAVFMQQQVWQMVGQIGESARKTVRVQLLNTAVAVAYLMTIGSLWLSGGLSVERVLWAIICLYAVATALSYRFLREQNAGQAEGSATYGQMFDEYWHYCKPLIGFAVVSFLYAFADKWMLQKFGGATQQGYFQIASQFAQVSLLATVSILNIFWKEIAEAKSRGERERVGALYKKVNRGLVMLSAVIAGLLLPWSKQIVALLLGPAYVEAWPVLAIMFLYPIHQSMGQIGGTMLMASSDTRRYVALSTAIMLGSLPLSYFAMAPTSGMLIPGLGLGAIGMACYMVLSSVIAVNIQAWVIARSGGWEFDWRYQAVGIPLMLGLGYAAKMVVGLIWNIDDAGWVGLVIPGFFACVVYGISVLSVVRRYPWLMGMEKDELRGLWNRMMEGARHAKA
ncbi:MAG: lipopolysaccharide biosynthesis protein [Nitrosomonadales bacterium]|nr:lipopolysaccharide biosynthesis protein [Nitrosomonadales bacterium]